MENVGAAEDVQGRRSFLRKMAGIGLIWGVPSVTIGSTVLTQKAFIDLANKVVDDTPVRGQSIPEDMQEITEDNILDTEYNREINGHKFKLLGVAHTRDFARINYNRLEEFVKNSKAVFSEGYPNGRILGEFDSYFEAIHDLCVKHNKSVYYFDPLSSSGHLVENVSGYTGVIASIVGARKLNKASTRREFMKRSALTASGIYAFLSSFGTSLSLKVFLHGGDSKTLYEKEFIYLNHVADERNVEWTNRLIRFSESSEADDHTEGDYFLVNTGRAHSIGIRQYLDHPFLRKIKSWVYAPTYGLVDSNECLRFDPIGGELIRLPASI